MLERDMEQSCLTLYVGPLMADFTMSLLIYERQLNDYFETFIFMLLCKI